MTCLLIDDEELSRKMLGAFIKDFCPQLEVVATYNSPKSYLSGEGSKNQVDIVFIDVEMPDIKGTDFIKLLNQPNAKVVVVSAHAKYAIDAFEQHADGYLLKPFDPVKLKELVDKLADFEAGDKNQSDKIAVADGQKTHYLNQRQIIRLEADGNYTRVIGQDFKLTAGKPLKHFIELLSAEFLKVSQSSIVNKNEILYHSKEDGGYLRLKTGEAISVSRRYKAEVLKELG